MPGEDVYVLGAGAIGCGVASALARNGHTPVLVTRWREHIRALRSGLTVLHPDGTSTIHEVQAQHFDEFAHATSPVGLAYLTAKCQGTRAYAAVLAERLATDGCAVTVQNGYNLDLLAAAVGRRRTLGGASMFGAVRTGPGAVRRTGALSDLMIGELDATAPTERAATLAALTTGGGWRTTVSDDIVGVVWSKWTSNVMVNPASVVFGLPVDELMEHPAARRLAVRIAAECGAVAAAEGVVLTRLPTMDVAAICARAVDAPAEAERQLREFGTLFPGTRVSSLQDAEAGRPTELPDLAGAMVERGRAAGHPMPATAGCYELASRVERRDAIPGQLDIVREAEGLLATW